VSTTGEHQSRDGSQRDRNPLRELHGATPFIRSIPLPKLCLPNRGYAVKYRVTPRWGTRDSYGLLRFSYRVTPQGVLPRWRASGEDAFVVSPAPDTPRPLSIRSPNAASAFAAAVVIPTVVLLVRFVVTSWPEFDPKLILWTALVAGVELLPAPAWRGINVSLGFPLLTAIGIVFPPGWAAVAAFVASVDPAELRRESTIVKGAFNRSQIAIAVFLASSTFHALADVRTDSMLLVIAAAIVASLVDYLTNLGLVIVMASLMFRVPVTRLARQLPRLQEFLVSYVGLAVIGAVLAALYLVPRIGFWSVVTVVAPLLLARQMFLRSHALEEAHTELQEREEILRELSNTMAEERADERLQIAGYLHDDLAQVLFRLSLQVDIARKLLEKDDLGELRDQLEKIRESKQETSDRIRALIRDLHRSPLGAKGLSEALESFTDEVGRDSGILFHRDVQEIPLPAPIALLVFHIAREGVMNALKHARATDMWITVAEHGDDFVLELKDNGAGFDTSQPGPEGHFGMAMMRERAKVGGGSFDVESAPGKGTTITVRFPIALLQRGIDSEQASANGTGRASLDTPGTTSREGEDSRDSVPA
jgi:signal transduction histidine kinase